MVIAQEPAQPLAALHGLRVTNVRIQGKQQDITFPLMISFSMVMLDIFAQRSPQGAFTKENDLRQTLVLHRPDPALRVDAHIIRVPSDIRCPHELCLEKPNMTKPCTSK